MADADHARSWCQELGRPSVNEIAALSIIVDLDLLPSRQPPNDINAILKSVAERFVMQGFWITAFSPDSSKQAQASTFWPLIKAHKREIDDQIFEYVGIGDIDKARIVQVAVGAANL